LDFSLHCHLKYRKKISHDKKQTTKMRGIAVVMNEEFLSALTLFEWQQQTGPHRQNQRGGAAAGLPNLSFSMLSFSM
jgi:hypothetical protein